MFAKESNEPNLSSNQHATDSSPLAEKSIKHGFKFAEKISAVSIIDKAAKEIRSGTLTEETKLKLGNLLGIQKDQVNGKLTDDGQIQLMVFGATRATGTNSLYITLTNDGRATVSSSQRGFGSSVLLHELPSYINSVSIPLLNLTQAATTKESKPVLLGSKKLQDGRYIHLIQSSGTYYGYISDGNSKQNEVEGRIFPVNAKLEINSSLGISQYKFSLNGENITIPHGKEATLKEVRNRSEIQRLQKKESEFQGRIPTEINIGNSPFNILGSVEYSKSNKTAGNVSNKKIHYQWVENDQGDYKLQSNNISGNNTEEELSEDEAYLKLLKEKNDKVVGSLVQLAGDVLVVGAQVLGSVLAVSAQQYWLLPLIWAAPIATAAGTKAYIHDMDIFDAFGKLFEEEGWRALFSSPGSELGKYLEPTTDNIIKLLAIDFLLFGGIEAGAAGIIKNGKNLSNIGLKVTDDAFNKWGQLNFGRALTKDEIAKLKNALVSMSKEEFAKFSQAVMKIKEKAVNLAKQGGDFLSTQSDSLARNLTPSPKLVTPEGVIINIKNTKGSNSNLALANREASSSRNKLDLLSDQSQEFPLRESDQIYVGDDTFYTEKKFSSPESKNPDIEIEINNNNSVYDVNLKPGESAYIERGSNKLLYRDGNIYTQHSGSSIVSQVIKITNAGDGKLSFKKISSYPNLNNPLILQSGVVPKDQWVKLGSSNSKVSLANSGAYISFRKVGDNMEMTIHGLADQRYTLKPGDHFPIGRNTNNLPQDVSENHLEVYYNGGNVLIKDNSRNGSKVIPAVSTKSNTPQQKNRFPDFWSIVKGR